MMGKGMFTHRGISVWKAISFFSLISVAVGFFSPSDAHAQTCGFVACEAQKTFLSGTGGQCVNIAGQARVCTCVAAPIAGTACTQANMVHLQQIRTPTGQPPLAPSCLHSASNCNCAARPHLTDNKFTGMLSSKKACRAGCEYGPSGPLVGWPDLTRPASGIYEFYSPDGMDPTGAQCNAATDPSATTPPPNPNCDGETCLSGEGNPPKICAEVDGHKICVDNGDCEGNQPAGYTCVGAPEANEPRPPDPPVHPLQPPKTEHPCVINGQECEVRTWKPPFDRPPCPEGWERDGDGNCVPDEEEDEPGRRCPDGSTPINNSCPAPYDDCADGTRPSGTPPRCHAPVGNCPDGSRPLNGVCGAVGGTCPNGQPPVNGMCTAQYGNCPNGQPPVAGQCQPGYANCPNGAQPVDGQCSVGGECDPATDPDGCEGAGDDNAGGGVSCDAQPFCSGDIIMCNVLQQQWQTRCATERAFGTDPDAAIGDDADAGEYDPNSVFEEGEGDGGNWDLDASGWLGGSACPTFPAVSVMGTTIDFGQIDYCWIFGMMHALVLAMAYFRAAQIIGRG